MPIFETPPPPPPYDVPALHALEGQARAAVHLLGRRLLPVQQRLETELAAFDLLNANAADCARRRELEGLLAALQPYCEITDAYVSQLRANLADTEEALHSEAVRGNFAMHECKLLNADNQRLYAISEQESQAFIELAARLRPAA